MTRPLFCIVVLAALACAQHRSDPRNLDHRVITVVPIVGKGTPDDPKRPQYAPWPPPPAGTRTGIIAYSWQPSDDGRFALVEFVAHEREALLPVLSDKQIKAFEKGKDKRGDLEKELKKFRKDFELDKFTAVRP